MSFDLRKDKKIHIIGIEGAGTSALAKILADMGKTITGSDEGDGYYQKTLLEKGIQVNRQFNRKNIPSDADLIIYSSTYRPETNEELAGAENSGKPLISYAEAVSQIFNEKFGIAVCGTHGKSTTTAMLGYVFSCLGLDPTVLAGSRVLQFQGNSLSGKSDYFILEADEYQNKLRFYEPKGVILTSADLDHPDSFETHEKYKKAFIEFVKKIPADGFLSVWGDSVDTLEIADNADGKIITYGTNEDNDLRIEGLKLTNVKESSEVRYQLFEVYDGKKNLGQFKIRLMGKHNALNATAVISVCQRFNLDMEKVKVALANFKGTARRFEYIGQKNGAIIIDDYAHHPEEIKATLSAARQVYPEKNIWAIFQPHTYSRTKELLSDFSQSFSDANNVIIIDIYGSAREVQGSVHSKDLAKLINKYEMGKAEYVSSVDETIEYLKKEIGPEDVVITIGAGDVWKISSKLKE